MNTLSFYANLGKERAKTDNKIYRDETYHFVETLFRWRHPERSTYRKEAVCISLIRNRPGREEAPCQIWIQTYMAQKSGEKYIYNDNFDYITRVIKALASLQVEGQFNLFMGYSTFKYAEGYNRTQEKAFRVKAVGIDLDFNKLEAFKNLSYKDSIKAIKKNHAEIFKKYSPMIVQSGGGCQLYFLLNKPLILNTNDEDMKKNNDFERFKQLSQYFNAEFADCGADGHCKGDTARIYRVPGCYSLKYGPAREVRLTAPGRPHGFRDIVSLPEPQKASKAAPRARKPKKSQDEPDMKPFDIVAEYGQKGAVNIVYGRLSDLETAIREKDGDIEGFRNQAIFVASALMYAVTRDFKRLLLKVLNFNELFAEPLLESEVEAIVRNVVEKDVKVSNNYIFDTLFKPWNTDLSHLRGKYTEKARKETERKRKAKSYQHKKEYSKSEKISYIKENITLKNSEIAKFLNCSTKTVQRLRKQVA